MPDYWKDEHVSNDAAPSDYELAQNNYSAERTRFAGRLLDDPAALLAYLTREPLSLRDHIALAVRWGMSRGLVYFHPELGVAYANQEFEQVDPGVLREWRKELDDCEPDELLAEYEYLGEPVFATHEERRAFKDLEYALSTGLGQCVALRGFEQALPEDVIGDTCTPSPVEEGAANYFLPMLGMVAEEFYPRDPNFGKGQTVPNIIDKTRMVPARVLEQLRPVFDAFTPRRYGDKQPLWIQELVERFTRPLSGDTAREAVDDILCSFASVAGAPEVFSRREPFHLAQAEAMVGRTPVACEEQDDDDLAWLPTERTYVPKRPRRGPPAKPWRAAALFARCFGVIIPDRERDALRRK